MLRPFARGFNDVFNRSIFKTIFFVVSEPLKFTMHPKSQTAKEGSRVEFTCKVNKEKDDNLVYQWHKDGVAVSGRNDSTLVLNVVELGDFGCYACHVKYQDSFNAGVKSNCATLDIIPQSRKGMSECIKVYFDWVVFCSIGFVFR